MTNEMMGGTTMLRGVLGLSLLLGFTAAIIFEIARPSRRGETSGDSTNSAEPALEILKHRLAQGEITSEQYVDLKHKVQ